MPVEELANLAVLHGTDKWNGHWYLTHYAQHLDYLRQEEFNLLEIGVGGYNDPNAGGASLRTWKDYFQKAKIIGLDYFDKSAHAEDRILIYQGSQADPRTISRIVNDFPDGLDVVIDDGSHRNEHVIASFLMLWQFVKPGGWYIVEDTQTSYWPNHGGNLHDRQTQGTSMGFFKSMIDSLNWQEMHQPGYTASLVDTTLVGMHFYHNIIFLRKGTNLEGSTEVADNRIKGV